MAWTWTLEWAPQAKNASTPLIALLFTSFNSSVHKHTVDKKMNEASHVATKERMKVAHAKEKSR
ncbi:conserved hypothetical protein [Ricinus communis]|uniref:Uncharacterized protein n=1 Tax=Ricinus communis TaxID=3988 RepID=B9T3B5_RICCO|nr:conserved hypothetical protein [Ricinus communis]